VQSPRAAHRATHGYQTGCIDHHITVLRKVSPVFQRNSATAYPDSLLASYGILQCPLVHQPRSALLAVAQWSHCGRPTGVVLTNCCLLLGCIASVVFSSVNVSSWHVARYNVCFVCAADRRQLFHCCDRHLRCSCSAACTRTNTPYSMQHAARIIQPGAHRRAPSRAVPCRRPSALQQHCGYPCRPNAA
jgi:hypothetical protein